MIDAITKWAFVLFIVMIGQKPTTSTPVWSPQAVNGDFGRNIRHLPCVSRRTGDTGVCMFAYSCAKANGTHLGTCIDRFFFGSCCKIPTSNLDLAAPLDSNNISEENVLGVSSTESYLLSTYQTVQLIKNTSIPYVTSTAKPIPDILPPVRKPSKPQITTNSPSKINTPKPPSIEVLNVSSTNLVFSKPTESPYVVSISTQKPAPPSSVTSPINNYSKPTKRPPINPNLSQTKPAVEKPAPKPTPLIKPVSSNSTGQIVVKPSKPTIKPALSNNKPSSSQTETKPILSSNKFKPSGNKTHSQTAQSPTKKPPSLTENKPAIISSNKPPAKIPKPSQKPLSTSKPIISSKPINNSKPSKPYISVSPKPITNSSISKPQNISKPILSHKPSPVTKPTVGQKPINSSYPMVAKPSSPTYIKVPLTSTPPAKVTVSSTTISNEILPEISNFSTVSSVEFEEEVSNLINGSPSSPTEIPPALVTWTTVDEVPVKPVSKPVSTPIQSGSIYNKTKIPVFTTIPSTTAQSWVEVSVSTHEPSQSEHGELGTVKPSTITSTPKPVATVSTTPLTTVGINITKVPSISVTSKPNVTTEVEQSTEATTVTTVSLSSTTTQSTPTASTTEPDLVLQSNYTDNEIETTLLNTSNFVEVCGRRLFPQSRIVGGDKATFGKWPWQISLRQWRTSTYLHKCGAALLNENWAITAAHCVENVPPSDLLLRLGEHDLSLEDEPYGYQERRVQIVASHPQFDSRTFEYDLALLRFYEPVTFQPNVIPVCVPQDDTNFVGSTAYVTGWGRLYEDGPLPSVLQEVSVPVINNTVCETMYRAAGYIEHIPEIFICAGWKKGGFDSCEGDSGGPMVIQRPDKRWLLAGVISWGIGCAEPNQPGVYTRISEFREWINQILQF